VASAIEAQRWLTSSNESVRAQRLKRGTRCSSSSAAPEAEELSPVAVTAGPVLHCSALRVCPLDVGCPLRRLCWVHSALMASLGSQLPGRQATLCGKKGRGARARSRGWRSNAKNSIISLVAADTLIFDPCVTDRSAILSGAMPDLHSCSPQPNNAAPRNSTGSRRD